MFAKYLSSVDSPALHVLHTRRWCSLSRSRFLFWQLPPTGSHVVCFYKFFPMTLLHCQPSSWTLYKTHLPLSQQSWSLDEFLSPRFHARFREGFFFFLDKNKFRWQWINYTVTNTQLIHFPPRRLLRLLTPGWRCSTLTALEGKFQSIPFHLIPVEFFPWPQHDRFSDGNLFFYTSLQPYCGVLPTAPSSDNTSTTAPWGKNTKILCNFFFFLRF